MVFPCLLTSTPNSVPRSVTVAVGVRTETKDEAMRDEWTEWTSEPFFHLRRQLAKRQEAAGGTSTSYVTGPCRMTLAPVS